MTVRIYFAATFALAFTTILPAKAADPQLVGLLMPDVKVIAGVNVDQAKGTPFGQYVLSQVQSNEADLQKLETLTGFNPTRDVHELLVGSNSAGSNTNHTGLVVARGQFDPTKIAAAAATGGGKTVVYSGVTIIVDPQGQNGVAFPDPTLAIAGDIANVKGAIDRLKSPTILPGSVSSAINQWSNSQDAWSVSTVPPSALHPPSTMPSVPGMNGAGAFQSIQSAAGGVKFGNTVVVTAQAVADTAQNAQAMGDALNLLANIALMQSQNNPQLATLAQSLQVSASGNILNVSISVPEDQLQQVIKQGSNAKPHGTLRKR